MDFEFIGDIKLLKTTVIISSDQQMKLVFLLVQNDVSERSFSAFHG